MKKRIKLILKIWAILAIAIILMGLYLANNVIFGIGGASMICNILLSVYSNEKFKTPCRE